MWWCSFHPRTAPGWSSASSACPAIRLSCETNSSSSMTARGLRDVGAGDARPAFPIRTRPGHLCDRKASAHPHAVMAIKGVQALRTFGPVQVSDGHYFMMGDNRDNSFDSRYFGTVDRGQIVGPGVERGSFIRQGELLAAPVEPHLFVSGWRHQIATWLRPRTATFRLLKIRLKACSDAAYRLGSGSKSSPA